MSEHCDKLEAKLDEAARSLGDVFDGVLILATVTNVVGNGQDVYFSSGSGNSFTKLGLAREYLIRNNEASRIDRRNQEGEDE